VPEQQCCMGHPHLVRCPHRHGRLPQQGVTEKCGRPVCDQTV
jgi:hypothetical protein